MNIHNLQMSQDTTQTLKAGITNFELTFPTFDSNYLLQKTIGGTLCTKYWFLYLLKKIINIHQKT